MLSIRDSSEQTTCLVSASMRAVGIVVAISHSSLSHFIAAVLSSFVRYKQIMHFYRKCEVSYLEIVNHGLHKQQDNSISCK